MRFLVANRSNLSYTSLMDTHLNVTVNHTTYHLNTERELAHFLELSAEGGLEKKGLGPLAWLLYGIRPVQTARRTA